MSGIRWVDQIPLTVQAEPTPEFLAKIKELYGEPEYAPGFDPGYGMAGCADMPQDTEGSLDKT